MLSRMSPVRRPRLVKVREVTVAAALACCCALAACSGSADSSSHLRTASKGATDGGSSLEDVDTTALAVPRGPFCDRIDPAAVARVLGGPATHVSAYRSGQRIKISGEVADVVHEFGCRWKTEGGKAEAWLFAPPVTRRRAARMVEEVQDSPRCLGQVGAPAFGRPSAVCGSPAHDGYAVTFRGLFGDAWLTCSLTLGDEPRATVEARAMRWCAAVATGAAAH
jgi:hypothetical protein